MKINTLSSSGYCTYCGTNHSLRVGNSYDYGQKLLNLIEQATSIDLDTTQELRDPSLSTDYLFGKARGKMFGVLECITPAGGYTFLHSFSGQYNGRWLVNGWVEPLFNVNDWYRTNDTIEKEIKHLTSQIIDNDLDTGSINQLKRERKSLSRQLMKEIHSLYQLTNFRGETTTLTDLFPNNNIPTGTGDCCGPKLLNYAAKNNLTPISMAEFYIGRQNRSGLKSHGCFYPPCKEKCQPLLGFMLCGLK